MIDLGHLREYSLFAGLADPTLDFLRQRLRHDVFGRHEVIITEGEPGDAVYFLQSGRVAVRLEGTTIAVLNEGEQFGEMHLIDIQSRSATVMALSEIETLSLGNQAFLDLRKHNMEAFIVLLMNCARDISRRLRQANLRLARLRSTVEIDEA